MVKKPHFPRVSSRARPENGVLYEQLYVSRSSNNVNSGPAAWEAPKTGPFFDPSLMHPDGTERNPIQVPKADTDPGVKGPAQPEIAPEAEGEEDVGSSIEMEE